MQQLDQTHKGWLAWFARNSVAANLLMAIILVAGVASVFTIKKQAFPEIQLEQVNIRVPYLGAAPQEVESGVIDKIESRMGEIVKQVSVDCKVIGVIEKRKDNRCF